jgi:hypothetical protein
LLGFHANDAIIDPLYQRKETESTMTKVEQHNIIEMLRDYMHKMHGRDMDDFEMLRKRDRDDEDLDEFSRRRLSELYVKYVPERLR